MLFSHIPVVRATALLRLPGVPAAAFPLLASEAILPLVQVVL